MEEREKTNELSLSFISVENPSILPQWYVLYENTTSLLLRLLLRKSYVAKEETDEKGKKKVR